MPSCDPARHEAHDAARAFIAAATRRNARVATDDELGAHVQLTEQLAAARAGVEEDLDQVLSQLDPIWARSSFVPASGRGMDLTEPGCDRFLWVLLSCAGGTCRQIQHIVRYRELCLEWLELWQVENLARPIPDDGFPESSRLEYGESLRRVLSTDTRLTWVSQLILEQTFAALEGSTSGPRPGPGTARALVRHLRRYALDAALWRGRTKPPSLPPEAAAVLEGIAVAAGQYAGRGFRTMLLSRDAETRPVVQVGAEAFPAAIRTALGGLEVGVIDWLAGEGVDKGALFEEVVRSALAAVAPPGVVVLPGDSRMRPALPRNDLQTDVVVDLPAERTTVVGEVKCYFPSRLADRSALGRPLKEAAEQANLRAASFVGDRVLAGREGWTLEASGRDLVLPLVIPLQSSGQTVWSAPSLREAGVPEGVVVMPVHQAVLVFSLMTDAADLRAYLTMRREALAHDVRALDEHPLLVLHLTGRAENRLAKFITKVARASAVSGRDANSMLAERSMPFHATFIKDRPPQRDLWRVWFSSHSTSFHPLPPSWVTIADV